MHDVDGLAEYVETQFEFGGGSRKCRNAPADPVTCTGGENHRDTYCRVAQAYNIDTGDQTKQDCKKSSEFDEGIATDKFFGFERLGHEAVFNRAK